MVSLKRGCEIIEGLVLLRYEIVSSVASGRRAMPCIRCLEPTKIHGWQHNTFEVKCWELQRFGNAQDCSIQIWSPWSTKGTQIIKKAFQLLHNLRHTMTHRPYCNKLSGMHVMTF